MDHDDWAIILPVPKDREVVQAMGVFGMAGGIGSIVGPASLGVLADRLGLKVVFWGIGPVLAASVLVVWVVISGRRARVFKHQMSLPS